VIGKPFGIALCSVPHIRVYAVSNRCSGKMPMNGFFRRYRKNLFKNLLKRQWPQRRGALIFSKVCEMFFET
jgi:hypothetical protein